MERCEYHDELVRGLGQVEARLGNIEANMSAIKTILQGQNGTTGIIGERNNLKGRAWAILALFVIVWGLVAPSISDWVSKFF